MWVSMSMPTPSAMMLCGDANGSMLPSVPAQSQSPRGVFHSFSPLFPQQEHQWQHHQQQLLLMQQQMEWHQRLLQEQQLRQALMQIQAQQAQQAQQGTLQSFSSNVHLPVNPTWLSQLSHSQSQVQGHQQHVKNNISSMHDQPGATVALTASPAQQASNAIAGIVQALGPMIGKTVTPTPTLAPTATPAHDQAHRDAVRGSQSDSDSRGSSTPFSGSSSSSSGTSSSSEDDESVEHRSPVVPFRVPASLTVSATSNAQPSVAVERKIRKSFELTEHERWYCPLQCGKFYKSSSSKSIAKHENLCPKRTTPLPINVSAALLAKQSTGLSDSHGNITRCICHDNDNSEGFRLRCDTCEIWQHAACLGVNEGMAPQTYYCEICWPSHPIHRHNSSVRKSADFKRQRQNKVATASRRSKDNRAAARGTGGATRDRAKKVLSSSSDGKKSYNSGKDERSCKEKRVLKEDEEMKDGSGDPDTLLNGFSLSWYELRRDRKRTRFFGMQPEAESHAEEESETEEKHEQDEQEDENEDEGDEEEQEEDENEEETSELAPPDDPNWPNRRASRKRPKPKAGKKRKTAHSDLPEDERWYCPLLCGRFFIRPNRYPNNHLTHHMKICPNLPTINTNNPARTEEPDTDNNTGQVAGRIPEKWRVSAALRAKQSTGHSDEEGNITRCICCENDNTEGFMLRCDSCGVWQHGDCLDLIEEMVPSHYYCEICMPSHPIHHNNYSVRKRSDACTKRRQRDKKMSSSSTDSKKDDNAGKEDEEMKDDIPLNGYSLSLYGRERKRTRFFGMQAEKESEKQEKEYKNEDNREDQEEEEAPPADPYWSIERAAARIALSKMKTPTRLRSTKGEGKGHSQKQKLKYKPRRVSVVPTATPHIGHGLNGLGYGQYLDPENLNNEYLKTFPTLSLLPISLSDKQRLVSSEWGLYPIQAGWYWGQWRKRCASKREWASTQPKQQPLSRRSKRPMDIDATQPDMQTDPETPSKHINGTDADQTSRADTNRAGDGKDDTDTNVMKEHERDDNRDDENGDECADEDGTGAVTKNADLAHSAAPQSCQSSSPLCGLSHKTRKTKKKRSFHSCTNGCWQMHGYGYSIDKDDGEQRIGMFSDGVMRDDPNGIIIDKLGVYHGDVKNAADTGYGVFYYRGTHNVACGLWEQGRLQHGSMWCYEFESLYTGTFNNNKPDGQGIEDNYREDLYLEYVGHFKNRQPHGIGRKTWRKNNKTETGYWKAGELQDNSIVQIEWETSDQMKATYIGPVVNGKPEGEGQLRWDSWTPELQKQKECEQNRRKNGRWTRMDQHEKRVNGDWTSALSSKRIADEIEDITALVVSLPTTQLSVQSDSTSLGSCYVGSFHEGLMHGEGLRTWDRGDIYSGSWTDGICDGYGRWLQQDRGNSLGIVAYDGYWKQDKEQGPGLVINSVPPFGRMIFNGRFYDGCMEGIGSIHYLNSLRVYYIGGFFKGLFNNLGLMCMPEGGFYVGSFQASECTGHGRWVDTAECSVYTGKFKYDYKHGCARLTVHTRNGDARENNTDTTETSTLAENTAIAEEEAAILHDHPAAGQVEMVPTIAAKRSSSHLYFPSCFGPVIASYLAVYDFDVPVFRIVPHDLDDVLTDIGYLPDGQDHDVSVIKEDVKDRDNQHKQKMKSRRRVSSTAVKRTQSGTITGSNPDQVGGGEVMDMDTDHVDIEECDAIEQLQYLQQELVHMKHALNKKTLARVKETHTHKHIKKKLQDQPQVPQLRKVIPKELRESLLLTGPNLSVFNTAASASHRRIDLPRAVTLAVKHRLCTFAVTGHLPADRTVTLCLTCTGDSRDPADRVEVCQSCRWSGCHRSHTFRDIEFPGVKKGETTEYVKGEAALCYCHCAADYSCSNTAIAEWREQIRTAYTHVPAEASTSSSSSSSNSNTTLTTTYESSSSTSTTSNSPHSQLNAKISLLVESETRSSPSPVSSPSSPMLTLSHHDPPSLTLAPLSLPTSCISQQHLLRPSQILAKHHQQQQQQQEQAGENKHDTTAVASPAASLTSSIVVPSVLTYLSNSRPRSSTTWVKNATGRWEQRPAINNSSSSSSSSIP